MVRHKGAISDAMIDRTHPHQVEIPIPERGLGMQIDVMHAFCRGREYATRGIGKKRINAGQDGMRWCFVMSKDADEFREQFGGEAVLAGK